MRQQTQFDPANEADIDLEWSAEIQKRLAEIESGQVKSIPWPEARLMILEESDDAAAT